MNHNNPKRKTSARRQGMDLRTMLHHVLNTGRADGSIPYYAPGPFQPSLKASPLHHDLLRACHHELQARLETAQEELRARGIIFPTLVDEMQNEVYRCFSVSVGERDVLVEPSSATTREILRLTTGRVNEILHAKDSLAND